MKENDGKVVWQRLHDERVRKTLKKRGKTQGKDKKMKGGRGKKIERQSDNKGRLTDMNSHPIQK